MPGTAYSYLLGVYLGDGYLVSSPKPAYFCIAMDSRYMGIIDECRAQISAVLPHRRSHLRRFRDRNLVIIRSYGREWLCLFPQHGSGRKHKRLIELADWQRRIVNAYPGSLLRGLIHSDGWRGLNRVHVNGRDYAYPRYQFSNRSADIRRIFCEACERLGIEWRSWGRWHISVARRDSVAKLDEFVGPKPVSPGTSAAPLDSQLFEIHRTTMRTAHHPEIDNVELAEVLHALSDPVRLEILRCLAENGECCCGELEVSVSKSTLSHHLSVLRQAGLTVTRADGTHRMVSLRRKEVESRFPRLLDAVLVEARVSPA